LEDKTLGKTDATHKLSLVKFCLTKLLVSKYLCSKKVLQRICWQTKTATRILHLLPIHTQV